MSAIAQHILYYVYRMVLTWYVLGAKMRASLSLKQIHMIISSLNKNKDWTIGATVNIGFMKNLTVISVEAVKDSLPDIYTLQSASGKMYEFIPHNGLRAL